MTEDDLSHLAKLADKVWRHLVFSGKFNNEKTSDLRKKYIVPIFGQDVADEIHEFYLNAKI